MFLKRVIPYLKNVSDEVIMEIAFQLQMKIFAKG